MPETMEISFSKYVKLTFPDTLIKQPLIYKMAQNYGVITNIEQANVNDFEGWVLLEITGTNNELDKALQWLADQGVHVQMMFWGQSCYPLNQTLHEHPS